MKKIIILFTFHIISWTVNGQAWQNVNGGLNDNVYDLIKFENKLYAGGRFGVKHWDGSIWTSLPNVSGVAYPLTLAIYNDTVYVGGDFPWSGSISHVYKYNGISWIQVGGDYNEASWSSTKKLLTFNNKLISAGRFTTINGDTIRNIAEWNGSNWSNMGNGLNGSVWNLAEHNGLLFASGNFTASGTDTTVRKLAKWDGNSWSDIDTTHKFNSAGTMISFNGNLIIGNVWDTISGTPMNGITEWDGNNFISIGSSLIKGVNNFWVFNNELYLSGKTYNLNPFDSDDVILKWNGVFWEQIGNIFNQSVITINDYNGELYCGGFFTSHDAEPISHIAKTNLTVGTKEFNDIANMKFYPNPTKNQISFETSESGMLTITNQIGQIVEFISISEPKTIIETNSFSEGIYFLKFQTNKGTIIKKLVKYD